MQPEHIVNINRNLTSLQRQRIEATPFKWMLHLEEEFDISSPLLRELISRWSVDDNCFRIRQHLVPFKVVDVCFALGLRVVGEELCLQDGLWRRGYKDRYSFGKIEKQSL